MKKSLEDDPGKGTPETTDNRRLLKWAAALSCATILAHAIDTPDHLNEWWGYATFFVIVAAIQFFLGVVLFLRPWQLDEDGKMRRDADRFGRPYFFLGIVLAASVIVLYIVTRTTGMPFLTDAVVEPLTPLSLVPVIENIPLLYCLVALVRRTRIRSMAISAG